MPMNVPPLPVTLPLHENSVTPPPPPPSSPPSSSSSSPPAPNLPVANDQIAAATEIHDQTLPRPLSSASGDTVINVEEEEDEEEQRAREELRRKEEWVKQMRGWLMVLATLSASVTYSAGLNPPGGFWQDDLTLSPVSSFNTSNSNITTSYLNSSIKPHAAGWPVLADKSPIRYTVFFSSNATAFLTSIAIIILLLNQSFFHAEIRLALLKVSVVGGMCSLVLAFGAGSALDLFIFIIVSVSAFCIVSLLFAFVIWRMTKKRPARPPMSSQERVC